MHGVLDRNTGKWVEGLTQDSTRWIHQWQAKGSQPGLEVKETSQFLITKSTGSYWTNGAEPDIPASHRSTNKPWASSMKAAERTSSSNRLM